MLKTRVTLGKSFGELLLEKGLLTKEKLQELLKRVALEKKKIEQLLIESGFTGEQISELKAEYLGYEFVNLDKYPLPPIEIWKHMKSTYANKYKVLPLTYENDILTIAMVEPRDFIALEEVIKVYKGAGIKLKNIKVVMTTTKKLVDAIARFYRITNYELEHIPTSEYTEKGEKKEIISLDNKEATEYSAPIIMLANKIIEEAFLKRASDIHLEPSLDHLRIRYRIDGEMMEVMRVDKIAQDAVIARYKIMSDMRLDEKRIPQDGRIDYTKYNPAIEIDLRVSTIPTPYGEDTVMRILDKKRPILSIESLGMSEGNLKLYKEAIKSAYGIILNVGPTGSGKTTALYAALKSLDSDDIKIVTAENPVEYTLGGRIIQSNINPAAGYKFDKSIRAFLRHDPDIILIGEIRDLETAKTAVEASLTGHLVFSTLHTNDAIGTVVRLTEMGIEPYLVADSLLLVCAQRLVRKLCEHCKTSYTISDEEISLSKGDFKEGTTLFKAKGCDKCQGTGYHGRTGIYEILQVSSKFRALLLNKATSDELKKEAINIGMVTLRQDAINKAIARITSFNEVISTTLNEKVA